MDSRFLRAWTPGIMFSADCFWGRTLSPVALPPKSSPSPPPAGALVRAWTPSVCHPASQTTQRWRKAVGRVWWSCQQEGHLPESGQQWGFKWAWPAQSNQPSPTPSHGGHCHTGASPEEWAGRAGCCSAVTLSLLIHTCPARWSGTAMKL